VIVRLSCRVRAADYIAIVLRRTTKTILFARVRGIPAAAAVIINITLFGE